MLDDVTNPILAQSSVKMVRLDDIDGHIRNVRKRKISPKREMMLLWRKENAVAAVEPLTKDVEICGMTKGQFSLLDLLKACL